MAKNAAFDILYREYHARVFGLCRKLLGSGATAEDATQETFMKAYKSFNRYDSAHPFWQWISTIASNHCIDVIRKRSRDSLFSDEQAELDDVAEDASTLDTLIEHQDLAAINEAISALPDKYRLPIVMAYFNDARYEQIADSLGITQSHVGVLLLRGRKQLRKQLSDLGASA